MVRQLFIIIIGIMLSTGLMATTTRGATPADSSTQQSRQAAVQKWALQFAIRSNFTLGNFQGSFLSGRYYFSPHRALQVGVSGNIEGNNIGWESTWNDSTFTPRESSETNGYIQLITQYLWIGHKGKRLQNLIGMGPTIIYQLRKTNVKTILSNNKYLDDITTQYTVEAGISGVIGLEWFITESIWLTMFYRNQLVYRWYSQSNEVKSGINGQQQYYRKDVRQENGVLLRNDGVFLGLTIQL